MRKEDLPELEALCHTIQTSGNGFSYAGRIYMPYNEQDTPLALLTRALYTECYIKNALKTTENAGPVPGGETTEQFIQRLSSANHSGEITDPGWTLQSILSPRLAQVSKYGVTRTMRTGPGFSAANGVSLSYRSQREDTESQPGFYYLLSNTFFEYTPPVARVYWNTLPEGALLLTDALSRELNRYRLPFLFKCLSDPGAYRRRDSCVLYIGLRHLQQTGSLLGDIQKDLAPFMKNDTPLFTKAWQTGVSVCESPADANSFGMSRMQTVARGLLNAFAAGDDPENYLRSVKNAFTSAGLNPELPFLEAGSVADNLLKIPVTYA